MTAGEVTGAGVVTIAGAGIEVPGHLTLQTRAALTACHEIYTIVAPHLAAALPPELVPKIRSLWGHYRPGMHRSDAYANEVEEILSAAERGRRVAYLTVGNPVFFDSVTQGLLVGGGRRGVRVELLAAVSSIDTVLADLGTDIAPGCQIYDASSAVAYDIHLRNDVPCLLLQLRAFGTSYVSIGQEPTPEAMRPLKDHLLRFHPPDHRVTYVTSAVQEGLRPATESFELRHLGGTAQSPQAPGASLYIPASAALAPDHAFLGRMADAANFTESYRPAAQTHSRSADPGPAKQQRSSALVLVSGGIDSAVLLHQWARSGDAPVTALHMTGIASRQETVAARQIAAAAGADLHTIDMGSFIQACQFAESPYIDDDGHRAVLAATTVYTAALAIALARRIPRVVIGLHRDDSATWAEQSPGFLDLVRDQVRMVGGGCELLTPFIEMSKADVVRLGADLGLDLSDTWSCLSSASSWQDGTCGACRDRRQAFESAGLSDRTVYRVGSLVGADSAGEEGIGIGD